MGHSVMDWWEVCGDSKGYWIAIAYYRHRDWREAEAQHETIFGKHWVVDKAERHNRRKYTDRQSPHKLYQPFGGYEFELPCLSRQKPKGWAAEPAGARPYGLRPFELKEAQALASIIVAPQVSDDPYHSQRLRDLRARIIEQGRDSGAAFQNETNIRGKDGLLSHEFARGVRWVELECIEQYRKHNQLRWFIASQTEDHEADPKMMPDWLQTPTYRQQPHARHIRQVRHGRDNVIAADEGYQFETVKFDRNALRERRKPGPKPRDGYAKSGAQRTAEWRARKKAS
jgi:hypothetical protein